MTLGGPETTEILIYGKLTSPTQSSSQNVEQTTIQLHVARLSFTPAPASLRLPRPDDPTPRKIPLAFGASSSPSLKRRSSESNTIAPKKKKLEAGKKGKTTTLEDANVQRGSAILSASGPGRVLGRLGSMNDGIFKVPVLPNKGKSSKGKGKSTNIDTEDVFGIDDSTSVVGLFGNKTKAVKNKGRGREDGEDGEMATELEVGEVEKANRAVRIPNLITAF